MDVSGEVTRFKTVMARIKTLDERDRSVIMEFYKKLRKDRVGYAKITNYLKQLFVIRKYLGKPLSDATEEDIFMLIEKLETMDYSESTKANFRITLKRLYGYDWIKTTEKKNKIKLPSPEELLTEDEVLKMASVCDNLRDSALIVTLYDLGCRPAELLRLKIKDLKFDEYGVVVHLQGKTGPRRVRGILSAPYLKKWLEHHPKKEDLEAPLWIVINPNSNGYLKESTLQKIVEKASKFAGIKKRVYPYLFRHSRATCYARFMTEAQMCEHFGWVQGSKMPRRYVHLSGRDVDDALLTFYNLKKKEEEKLNGKPQRCQICGEINPPGAETCWKCMRPLDQEKLLKGYDELKKEIKEELLRELLGG